MGIIEVRPAWKIEDPALMRDAQILRDTLLPGNPQKKEEWLKELAAIAYDDEHKVVGLCAARPIEYKALRARVFYFRAAILPGSLHDEIVIRLLSISKNILRAWADEHPGERLKGILMIFDSDAYDGLYSEPVLRRQDVELVLAGCTDEGRQIRMLWFDDARLEK